MYASVHFSRIHRQVHTCACMRVELLDRTLVSKTKQNKNLRKVILVNPLEIYFNIN